MADIKNNHTSVSVPVLYLKILSLTYIWWVYHPDVNPRNELTDDCLNGYCSISWNLKWTQKWKVRFMWSEVLCAVSQMLFYNWCCILTFSSHINYNDISWHNKWSCVTHTLLVLICYSFGLSTLCTLAHVNFKSLSSSYP